MAGTTTGPAVDAPVLKRLIKVGVQGADVKACKRAAARAGFPKGKLSAITDLYTEADAANIKRFQQANGLEDDGKIGKNTLAALVPHMDAFALQMYASFDPSTVAAVITGVTHAFAAGELAYPHPAGAPNSIANGIPKGFHETGGLANNWALDFMAPGGTPLLAPENMTIT